MVDQRFASRTRVRGQVTQDAASAPTWGTSISSFTNPGGPGLTFLPACGRGRSGASFGATGVSARAGVIE